MLQPFLHFALLFFEETFGGLFCPSRDCSASQATWLASIVKKIINYLSDQKGCLISRMTGSGSVLVAYFHSKKDCDIAKVDFKRKFNKYWCDTSKTL